MNWNLAIQQYKEITMNLRPQFNLSNVFARFFGKANKEKANTLLALNEKEAGETKEKRIPKRYSGSYGINKSFHFGLFAPLKPFAFARQSATPKSIIKKYHELEYRTKAERRLAKRLFVKTLKASNA